MCTDQSQTTASSPAEPKLCKKGCGFFVSHDKSLRVVGAEEATEIATRRIDGIAGLRRQS